MSWMAKLYQTYEQGQKLELSEDEQLMPICHTLQNAHINIVIDSDGRFVSAKVIKKTQVVLPATEKSAGRSSGEAPHALADKLQYIAADYPKYGGTKKPYFESYAEQLNSWCMSEYSHSQIQAVCKYVNGKTVIGDLISAKICYVDENGALLTRWPDVDEASQAVPDLFQVLPKTKGRIEQGDALVCWSVHQSGAERFDTWRNEEIHQCWIDFDSQNDGDTGLCFITGEVAPYATNHPAKIRHTGDKAKLVSANDSSGFTYRGRFESSENSANVSFEVTQKAHNALRWLIGQRNHAYRNGDQVILSWAVSGKRLPPVVLDLAFTLDEPFSISPEDETDELDSLSDTTVGLGQQFAIALKKYMYGYKQNFAATPTESVIVMGLDSATPGRMAITYYRDFAAQDYIDQLSLWHEQFAWPQRVVKDKPDANGKKKSASYWIPGAPTPWAVLNACYGDIVKSNETLKKQVLDRLLPCIVERSPLPVDLLRLSVRRASNPNLGEYWEWERNLGVACALYKGYHHPDRQPDKMKQRVLNMALDEGSTSRDYLFGRLLALAEKIEQQALFMANVNRPTTSQRLMQRFADRPSSTWLIIFKQLDPYMRQLRNTRPGFIVNREKEIDAIVDKFTVEDFTSDKALSGEFLLGFHSQRLEFRHAKSEVDSEEKS